MLPIGACLASLVCQRAGWPYIDLDAGVFYRAWEGEAVADNKRALLFAFRAACSLICAAGIGWAKYVVEYNGKPADPKRAFKNLVDQVLGEDAKGVVRHALRHAAPLG
ncbi:hypothetical protein FHT82_005289 [Rhizobium sp. BK275]|uniref:hypothetical protein n=1 Tax=Rhizobium sp. BK275 TaxID=2587077 RepID=UPI0017E77C8F|nr:hypothetical protein [Rhizobium sp. BK275]MBB3392502.1 hypothetical protein [Rhizobium sp. BK275]